MAIIAQGELFGWEEIGGPGDLERLPVVNDHLLCEELMLAREKSRAVGG